jgi:LemA protein
MVLIILLIVLGVIIFYLWQNYNFFVTAKTRIGASIQEIGNQLKRQTGLIPNLIESTKGYLKHEKDVYKKITEARSEVVKATQGNNAQAMMTASEKLIKALNPIRVILESNPELKASETVSKLMGELRDTADKIMYARRTLIDLTADYNTRLATFPSNLVANLFKFRKEAGLVMAETKEATSVTVEETKTPTVKL